MQSISFPKLGLEFIINPVAIYIFKLPIYWYGIIISFGFLIAFFISIKEAKRINLDPEVIMDIIIIATPISIIGARLYYVAFNWSLYRNNYKEILSIRHGGLAIYGAIIMALLSATLYCKRKQINVWRVLDVGALGLILAQSIGRWGNFVNQEAYGKETSLIWGMGIYDIEAQKRITVHPTFLYESLWNAIGFIFLIYYRKNQKFKGEIFLLYSLWYGIGRFWIEGLRTDSLYLGPIRISQILAFLFVCLSVGIIFYKLKIVKKNKNL